MSQAIHDIKNPINAMNGYLEMILGDLNDDNTENIIDDLKEVITINFKMAENITNLINKLKEENLAKKEKKELLNLLKVFEGNSKIHKINAEKKKLDFQNNIPDDIDFYGNEEQIVSILDNLIANSIKFTANGSIIISAEDKGEYIEIKVSDTGTGIKEEDMTKIFDQDFSNIGTNNEPGTGKGMSFCKTYVEKHNGSINVQSTINKGTIIQIKLPKVKSKKEIEKIKQD